MTFSNSQTTGRCSKVGKSTPTQEEKTIMNAIKALIGTHKAIWVNQSEPKNTFFIDVYATELTKYGFGPSTTQQLYTNVIRKLKGFKTLEIVDMELSTFKIEV
jgi:hypothetical protein